MENPQTYQGENPQLQFWMNLYRYTQSWMGETQVKRSVAATPDKGETATTSANLDLNDQVPLSPKQGGEAGTGETVSPRESQDSEFKTSELSEGWGKAATIATVSSIHAGRESDLNEEIGSAHDRTPVTAGTQKPESA